MLLCAWPDTDTVVSAQKPCRRIYKKSRSEELVHTAVMDKEHITGSITFKEPVENK